MNTCIPLRQLLESNSTGNAAPANVPTATKPTGENVVDLYDPDLGLALEPHVPSWLKVVPFLADADDETAEVYITGWTKTTDDVWVPQILALLACTAGNITAATFFADSFLCDTIAATDGGAADGVLGVQLISPENNTPGHAMIPLRGVELVEFDFDVGTAESVNVLYSVMN